MFIGPQFNFNRMICAAILAAGSSSRLGTPKQLLKLDGQTLIERAARAALGAGLARVLVIVGRDGDAIRQTLRELPVEVYFNPAWPEGMASSVRLAVENAGQAEALLLTPCDLPRLSSAHLRDLIETWQNGDAPIVASRYNETLGAPLVIGRALWPELLKLRGDVGARRVIVGHEAGFIEWPEGAWDVDTREDWEKYGF